MPEKPKKARNSIWKHDLKYVTEDEIVLGVSTPWYIISPESKYINYWNKVMTVLLVYTAIVTPYRLSFIDNDDDAWKAVEYTVTSLFFCDLIITCFVAYYDSQKNLIVDQKKIITNYIFGWMLIDLFSCIPITEILGLQKKYNSLVRVSKLPRLYRLFRITKLLRITKVMKNSSELLRYLKVFLKVSLSFERIFWFLFTYMVLIHIVACLWVFVAKTSSGPVNWIVTGNYQDLGNQDLYIVSLYWTITTFSTVGYGDIVAVAIEEKIFTITVMTIGIIFYSYTVSSITNVISCIDDRKARYKNHIMILDDICKKFRINKTFYLKICNALEFAILKTNYSIQDLVSELPGTLGNQLLIVVYQRILMENAFFVKKKTEFVAWVVPKLRYFKANSGELIYTEEDYASQMFFISKGTIEYILIKNNMIFPYIVLEKGYYFGEVDLLFSEDKLHLHSTRASGSCELLTFSRENFFKLLNNFEEEAVDICLRAKERHERIKNQLEITESKIKSNTPVDKRKSYPNKKEILTKIKVKRAGTENSEFVQNIRNTNMFNRIMESKLNIKEIDRRIIKKAITHLESEAQELKEFLLKLQEVVGEKYPNFFKKFPNLPTSPTSPDASMDFTK